MNLQEWIEKGEPLNSFLNCNCMEFMKDMPDKYFDLAIVDPPFPININGGGRFRKQMQNTGWLNKIPKKDYFKELIRISISQIIWGGNYFTDFLSANNNWIVWYKNNAGANFSQCELAWCSIRKNIMLYSQRTHTGIVKFHPCAKPIQLYRWLLMNYAKKGDKIFDSHVGSASSLIACHLEGFKYVGCELDSDYYKQANERLEAYKAQGSLF
jgi:site-specific DNA-methyltransferase (adenine-specific)